MQKQSPNVKHYRSSTKYNKKVSRNIGDNIKKMGPSYGYKNGYFGETSKYHLSQSPNKQKKANAKNSSRRRIVSVDNRATARRFFNRASIGASVKADESWHDTKMRKPYRCLCLKREMKDGTVVTYRNFSRSDNTPVVEFNVNKSKNRCGLKNQKIHFERRKK